MAWSSLTLTVALANQRVGDGNGTLVGILADMIRRKSIKCQVKQTVLWAQHAGNHIDVVESVVASPYVMCVGWLSSNRDRTIDYNNSAISLSISRSWRSIDLWLYKADLYRRYSEKDEWRWSCAGRCRVSSCQIFIFSVSQCANDDNRQPACTDTDWIKPGTAHRSTLPRHVHSCT